MFGYTLGMMDLSSGAGQPSTHRSTGASRVAWIDTADVELDANQATSAGIISISSVKLLVLRFPFSK